MPLIRAVIDKVSDAISFFLVSLIGRSLGLIYTGIRQSLRWKWYINGKFSFITVSSMLDWEVIIVLLHFCDGKQKNVIRTPSDPLMHGSFWDFPYILWLINFKIWINLRLASFLVQLLLNGPCSSLWELSERFKMSSQTLKGCMEAWKLFSCLFAIVICMFD